VRDFPNSKPFFLFSLQSNLSSKRFPSISSGLLIGSRNWVLFIYFLYAINFLISLRKRLLIFCLYQEAMLVPFVLLPSLLYL
jgi:hypothetical protein